MGQRLLLGPCGPKTAVYEYLTKYRQEGMLACRKVILLTLQTAFCQEATVHKLKHMNLKDSDGGGKVGQQVGREAGLQNYCGPFPLA